MALPSSLGPLCEGVKAPPEATWISELILASVVDRGPFVDPRSAGEDHLVTLPVLVTLSVGWVRVDRVGC